MDTEFTTKLGNYLALKLKVDAKKSAMILAKQAVDAEFGTPDKDMEELKAQISTEVDALPDRKYVGDGYSVERYAHTTTWEATDFPAFVAWCVTNDRLDLLAPKQADLNKTCNGLTAAQMKIDFATPNVNYALSVKAVAAA